MNLPNVHPISDRPNTTVPSPTAGTVLGGDVAWGARAQWEPDQDRQTETAPRKMDALVRTSTQSLN